MNSSHLLRSLVCGALLAVASASSISAEGSFDIPPGARFNPQKLERVGDFLRDQIAEHTAAVRLLIRSRRGHLVLQDRRQSSECKDL